MSERYKLIIQFPKEKIIGNGTISIDEKTGSAIFITGDGEKIIASMERTQLRFAAADGILISGMEACGCDKRGMRKFVYQEWYLNYHLDR